MARPNMIGIWCGFIQIHSILLSNGLSDTFNATLFKHIYLQNRETRLRYLIIIFCSIHRLNKYCYCSQCKSLRSHSTLILLRTNIKWQYNNSNKRSFRIWKSLKKRWKRKRKRRRKRRKKFESPKKWNKTKRKKRESVKTKKIKKCRQRRLSLKLSNYQLSSFSKISFRFKL